MLFCCPPAFLVVVGLAFFLAAAGLRFSSLFLCRNACSFQLVPYAANALLEATDGSGILGPVAPTRGVPPRAEEEEKTKRQRRHAMVGIIFRMVVVVCSGDDSKKVRGFSNFGS